MPSPYDYGPGPISLGQILFLLVQVVPIVLSRFSFVSSLQMAKRRSRRVWSAFLAHSSLDASWWELVSWETWPSQGSQSRSDEVFLLTQPAWIAPVFCPPIDFLLGIRTILAVWSFFRPILPLIPYLEPSPRELPTTALLIILAIWLLGHQSVDFPFFTWSLSQKHLTGNRVEKINSYFWKDVPWTSIG